MEVNLRPRLKIDLLAFVIFLIAGLFFTSKAYPIIKDTKEKEEENNVVRLVSDYITNDIALRCADEILKGRINTECQRFKEEVYEATKGYRVKIDDDYFRLFLQTFQRVEKRFIGTCDLKTGTRTDQSKCRNYLFKLTQEEWRKNSDVD